MASMFSMFTRPLSFVTNLFRFSLANVSERCLACFLVFVSKLILFVFPCNFSERCSDAGYCFCYRWCNRQVNVI